MLHTKKLISWEDVPELVQLLQKEKKNIVGTNGCFDVLHAGHVDYLQRAKKHGDILWIGLNSDSSVKAIKGPSRPIHSENARAFVLAGLSCVDYITVFSESTPVRFIEAIKPRFHVKGGDYNKETLPEYSSITAHGGELVIEPFVDGYSTTSILEKGKS